MTSNDLACNGVAVAFGMMVEEYHMVVHHQENALKAGKSPFLTVNQQRGELSVHTPVIVGETLRMFRFKQKLAQIASIRVAEGANDTQLFIRMQTPPEVAYKSQVSSKWIRQTTIPPQEGGQSSSSIKLLTRGATIEPGRWLTIRFHVAPPFFIQLEAILNALDTIPKSQGAILMEVKAPSIEWTWLHLPQAAPRPTNLSMLAHTHVILPFEVMYQLEVCISHGYLIESTLHHAFAMALEHRGRNQRFKNEALSLLEHVARQKQRLPNPMDLFKIRLDHRALHPTLAPDCMLLQSATVTPTTIYFHTPTVEVTNRVLREYQQYASHFLRVKFRDEEHLGRVRACDDDTDYQVFQRFKQALEHGITVGGRTFEFLAYGNSQLRENGAYFFAPISGIDAESVRREMGVFEDIKVVAKYASRLGQAFSTTRVAYDKIDIVDIPDIEHNGHCFTDGVGKMSPFVANMIAKRLELPSAADRHPCAFQFRLAGYKGIIVTDPNMTGSTVQLRPSQNKFPADANALEICRAAQYSAAFLNQQIILLLSNLGVNDEIILIRQQEMLIDLGKAMENEVMAKRLLLRSVDLNRTTESLVYMIQDGFMQTKEPFFTSCLRLWYSWSVKFLKEKARILLPESAFLLGCVDETGALDGHSDDARTETPELRRQTLPKIFVQTKTRDAENAYKVRYDIIKGICIVARNPSLHPGDIRVVEAIDVPELHHLHNVVVFPSRGDRDIPGMCSGGDLDGDDYLVIWDHEMIPRDWNHAPMDYTPPRARKHTGPVTVRDITNFFVEHMRNDNLGRIATAHRFWADQLEHGPRDRKCIELAALHSRAVDYAKSGVPAVMGQHLRIQRWPRWAGKTNVPEHCIYDSDRILHRLYREIELEPLDPARQYPFDERILEAYPFTSKLRQIASDIKVSYDAALRALMHRHGISSEFEIWTGFVMSHNQDVRAWDLAEQLGNAMAALKQEYRGRVFGAANNLNMRQIGPLLVAVYTVTAEDVGIERFNQDKKAPESLMSFPWIFQRELGHIANKQPVYNHFSPSPSVRSEDMVDDQNVLYDPTKAVESSLYDPAKAVERFQKHTEGSTGVPLLETDNRVDGAGDGDDDAMESDGPATVAGATATDLEDDHMEDDTANDDSRDLNGTRDSDTGNDGQAVVIDVVDAGTPVSGADGDDHDMGDTFDGFTD